ncbi:MAG TPA: right-handed parallel beta-helix repeat-containing protein [Polyangia bacterium]
MRASKHTLRPLKLPMSSGLLVVFIAASLGACNGASHSLGTSCLPSGTERELQAAIDTQERVLLCPRAVITLSAAVVLRQGLTLETAQRPLVAADLATLLVSPTFVGDDPLVSSGSNIEIAHVRIDGNRRAIGPRPEMALVRLGPGNDYDVTDSVFTDVPGWSHLHLLQRCQRARIANNVVESADRPHGMNNTDGFSVSCQDTIIENNRINDISGVGIVYFGGPGTQIRNNVITQSTTSASSGINVGDAVVVDHTGVVIENNRIVTTGTRYFHIGIAAGLHPWTMRMDRDIRGVTVRNNVISGRFRYGLAVDGCIDCVLEGNQILDFRPLAPAPACPAAAPYVANVANAHAGGSLQPGYVDAVLDGCLGPPIPE